MDDTIACESLSIDLNDIKEIFVTLTDDQRNIIMHIYYIYKKNNTEQSDSGEVCEENPKIILQGPAGTGKSTIINFIEKLITWEENKSSDSPEKLKVIKCAFTGKAASNIDGLTLHCMLSISIYNTRSLAKKRLNEKKEWLENAVFFICDEISMVGKTLLNSVNMRLQQIFGNDKLYGDRFVLLVGDLYQIDPIQQKTIYPDSPLWTCCKFYELTKIIRQQDEQFINALNNFRDSKLTQENIDLLKSREIQDIDQVPDSVIHLFNLNDPVDDFNIYKINKSNEHEEIVNAIDDTEKWVPANLRVKIGIRYMITKNLDVADGLANGTTGIVKGFDYDKNGRVFVIWMDLHSQVTGKKARLDYFKKHTKPGFENWVPIHQSSVLLKMKDKSKRTRVFNNMFPLKAAEAITVHKSQGQTYEDGVCVHITKHPQDKLRYDKSLQYVALTRVKRLEDLYIIGNLDVSAKQSKQFIKKSNEMDRLRTERKLKLAYETFEDNEDDVIIFLNTGLTFNEHYQFITTDKWYGNGSLLIFTETNTIGLDEIEIPNFEIVYRSDYDTVLRSGGGIICYKESSKYVEVISSLKDDDNKTHLTLLLYENYLYIVTGVKGALNDDDFSREIAKFIVQYVQDEKCVIFIGNFNPNTAPLTEFLDDKNIKKEISCDISDTNECDVVFTRNYNILPDRFGFYEYIPSSHKPIYVKVPPNPELGKRHGENYSVDSEKPGTSVQHDVQEAMEVE